MGNEASIDLSRTERLLKVYANMPAAVTNQKPSYAVYNTIKPSSPRSSPLLSVGFQQTKWAHQLEPAPRLRAHA
jgi:hypothetical protein